MIDFPMLDPLSELFRKYGSDKGGEHLKAGDTCHNYGQAYHAIFKDRREQVERVLEIGIAYGCSLRAWRDYFPHALIYGIDANPACVFKEDRIDCIRADQGDRSDLSYALAMWRRPKFDLIVDDGSHEPWHQIFSAYHLLDYLSDDGIYVIEDIEPDCKPELIGGPIQRAKSDFVWRALPTGHGIGRAHCQCGKCDEGEQLVIFSRKGA